MKIILVKDVENLGRAGEIVEVSDGFGRNYLIPKELAVVADRRNMKMLEHQKSMVEARVKKESEKANSFAEKLEGREITLKAKVGDEGKLFGSVTSADIAEGLNALGFEVDKKQVLLDSVIKSMGEHRVKVRVSSGVSAEVIVTVLPEE